jgi:LCP family protein required for cell wall assembly
LALKRNVYVRPPAWGSGSRRLFARLSAGLAPRVSQDGPSEGAPWRFWARLAVVVLLLTGGAYLSVVAVNILVLGTDDVEYAQHTDTILLLHWRPLPRRLSLLSVPRDTQVVLPKRGLLKINAVYAYGNALNGHAYALAMTRSTLENLLNTKIHYVIHVRYSSFITLVDAMGGVPLYIPKRMFYTDLAGGVNIDLMPGYQLLDGRQSLNYVRFRHDEDGDLGRMRRQQEFVRAFALQLTGFTQLPRTVRAFYAFVHRMETDLDVPTAFFLALEMKSVAGTSWRQAILPGQAVYVQGISYWQTDPKAVRETMEDLGNAPRPKPTPAPTAAAAAPETEGEPAAASLPAPEATPAAEAAPRGNAPRSASPKTAPDVPSASPAPPHPATAAKFVKVPLPKSGQPIIRILNGCGVPGVCKLVGDKLARHNVRLNPKNLTNAPNFGFGTSLVKTSAKNLSWAHAVAKMLGIGQNQIQIVPDNVSYPAVTVVVGKDYPEWVK